MSNFSFKVGCQLEWEGRTFEVTESVGGKVVMDDLLTNAPHTTTKSALTEAYRCGSLEIYKLAAERSAQNQPIQIDRSLADYAKARQDEALAKLHYLEHLCPRGRVLYKRSELREKLRELWEQLPDELRRPKPPCVASFYKWRDAWIRSGYQPRAMVNKFDLRGRKCKECNPHVRECIDEAIETTYLQLNRPSITETLDHANGLIAKKNQNAPPIDQIPRACRRDIIRAINRIGRLRRLASRHGDAKAAAATDVYGKKEEPQRVLERVEVDHTPLDVIALSSEGGILGRPNLTVLIDVASRMILGIWISFQPPNSGSVLRALKIAISSKKETLKKLRIKSPYPAEGMIENLFLDNGLEFHGNDLEDAAMDLRAKLVYCPRRQPRFKGVVERWLKEINYRFMHLLPGTTLDHFEKRDGLEPHSNAVIPIEHLKRLVWKWVVEVYSVSWHRGIQTWPREKWKELVAKYPPVKALGRETLTFYTSPIFQRRLSSKGIEINGQHYVGEDLSRIRCVHGDIELTVRPDLDDLGKIYVLDPGTKTYCIAQTTNPSYASGLSVEEDKWIRKIARDKYRALDYETGKLLAKQEIRDEVAEIKKSAEARADDVSKFFAKGKKQRTRAKKAVHAVAAASNRTDFEVNQAASGNDQKKAGRTPNFEKLTPYPTGQSPLF